MNDFIHTFTPSEPKLKVFGSFEVAQNSFQRIPVGDGGPWLVPCEKERCEESIGATEAAQMI